jgi:site-specific recombinase XerD
MSKLTRTLADMPIPEVVKVFLNSPDYSTNTKRNYRLQMERFREFIGKDITAKQVTMAMLIEFRNWVAEKITPNTARSAADALTAVVKFADPSLLPDRRRGSNHVYHIRLDISDKNFAKDPGRMRRVLDALMTAIEKEGGVS